MTRAPFAGGLVLAIAASPLCAAEPNATPEPEISAAATGYWYAMPDQPDFGVGVATLDRGPLHLEARYNYEARNSASMFAGWKFSGGDKVMWSATPIIGGLFGATRGGRAGTRSERGMGKPRLLHRGRVRPRSR